MFNFHLIDKTPTVQQIKAIIEYMEADTVYNYNFSLMMGMTRPKPNKIKLDLNDAGFGTTYEILFNANGSIESFKNTGCWIS